MSIGLSDDKNLQYCKVCIHLQVLELKGLRQVTMGEWLPDLNKSWSRAAAYSSGSASENNCTDWVAVLEDLLDLDVPLRVYASRGTAGCFVY